MTGNDEQTQYVLNLNVVPHLLGLLDHPKKNIRKEACWTISNITAGTAAQIQLIISNNVVPKLVHLLFTAEFDVQKEAAWAISNATSGGTEDQVLYIVQQQGIAALASLLDPKKTLADVRIITVALEGLENILKHARRRADVFSQVMEMFHEVHPVKHYILSFIYSHCYHYLTTKAQAVDFLENLQHHQNSNLAAKATKILETYWNAEDVEDTNLTPSANGSVFSFTGAGTGPGTGQYEF